MRGVILAGLVLFAACSGRSSDQASPRSEDAVRAVEAWFATAAARDCDALRAMTIPSLDAARCEQFLSEFHGRGTRLLAVESAIPDSRLVGSFVVQTSVHFRHRSTNKHRWMLRVERERGTWKVHTP